MRVVETGCRCWVLVVRMVETAGAGAAGAGCCDLAVRVVETGCRCVKAVHVVERGCRVLVLGAGYRCWVLCELACRCSVLVPASDSEVKTDAASDSEG